MENKELLDTIQEKIIEIHNEAKESLKRLGEKEGQKFNHIRGLWDCDLPYYRDVARHAWAERAKQIAMLEMQTVVNQLRRKLEQE